MPYEKGKDILRILITGSIEFVEAAKKKWLWQSVSNTSFFIFKQYFNGSRLI
jgi:hypothetical protein